MLGVRHPRPDDLAGVGVSIALGGVRDAQGRPCRRIDLDRRGVAAPGTCRRRVGGLGTIGTHTDCPVIYQPMGGGDSKEPALNRFHYTEQVRTARQVQRDYTFTHPRYDQQHTATGDQDLKNQHKEMNLN